MGVFHMDKNRNNPSYNNERIDEFNRKNNASTGLVTWSPIKSIWISSMTLGGIFGGYLYFSWSALALFFITCGITLCAGHSVGMHRKLIHQSFACPRWLEKTMVYLGTLVGLGGPFTMIYTHDMRDWAQRQPHCHDYFAHRRSILKDAWWQMHCDIQLEQPPEFIFDLHIRESLFYRIIDKTAMWQQLPWALLFFTIGGWSWVFWGICARVAIGVTGHWFIGYFAHNSGGRRWHVEGACVQGHDVNFCGLITFGECWHNNHHAFPGSAKLGIYERQMDPGWWLIKLLEAVGLVSNIRTYKELSYRPELKLLKTAN